MPRRIPDYAVQFTEWNMISSVGGFVFGISQLLFVWIIIKCVRAGKKADEQVWEGARGLEWTLPVAAAVPYVYHSAQSGCGSHTFMTGTRGQGTRQQ